jgi:hypothetical protein
MFVLVWYSYHQFSFLWIFCCVGSTKISTPSESDPLALLSSYCFKFISPTCSGSRKLKAKEFTYQALLHHHYPNQGRNSLEHYGKESQVRFQSLEDIHWWSKRSCPNRLRCFYFQRWSWLENGACSPGCRGRSRYPNLELATENDINDKH